MTAVALKLHAVWNTRLDHLRQRWQYFRQRRREVSRQRKYRLKQEENQRSFELQDSIRRGDHWPTVKLLLKTDRYYIDLFSSELLAQLEHLVWDEITVNDVDRFTGRMQRAMLLIFRLWDEPRARAMYELLCDEYGEACISQDLENIETMWNDIHPSSWFSKNNDS